MAPGITFLFLLVAAGSGNLEHFLWASFFISATLLYSHPLIRFKNIPFFDSIVGGPLVYLSPALIAFSLRGSVFNVSPLLFLLALPMIGFHAVSTLNDAKYDHAAGMRSTGIFLGRKNTLLFALAVVIIPLTVFALNKNVFLTSLLIVMAAGISLLAFSKMKYDDKSVFSLTSIFVYGWVTSLVYYFLSIN